MGNIREDKDEIVRRLGEAFAVTYEDIGRMSYIKDMYNDAEFVVVYDRDDNDILEVNVHWDSGCNIIYDVAKAVMDKIVLG